MAGAEEATATEPRRRPDDPTIRLGVSACLLGQNVRFDGGHKRDPFLTRTLGRYVEWVPVCPEVAMGLGVPRESLRLSGSPIDPRLVARSGQDHTAGMEAWAERQAEEFVGLRLHGFILKKDSPSCGLDRVRVYGESGPPTRNGQGIFARALINRMPCLPVEEEGRLHDMRLRENFVQRVFTYCRWMRTLDADPTPAGLATFQREHRLTLLAHSPRHRRDMERLVRSAGRFPWERVLEAYGCLLTEGLYTLATPHKHARVLHRLLGYLRDGLSHDDLAELVELVEDYRNGLVPLIVPLTLLKHHLNRHPVPDWVHQQAYLNPYPKELMLRNHV